MTTYRIFRRARRVDVQVISAGRHVCFREFYNARAAAKWLCAPERVGTIEYLPEGRTPMPTLADRYIAAEKAWLETGSADAADAFVEAQCAMCEHLDIPENETEQGLTHYAQSLIDAYLYSGGE